MAKYKINRRAILTDSDGTRDLIAESLTHTGTFTATNTIDSLSRDYFSNYFDFAFQGSTSGYSSGGTDPGATLDHKNIIQKFPFSSDANATDVGDLVSPRAYASGQSSKNHGYSTGGNREPPTFGQIANIIEKFPFSSDDNATDVGDLTQKREKSAGQSSAFHGYASGGGGASPTTTFYTTVDKFPFGSDTNATDVGDLTVARSSTGGQSSPTHGYTSGGRIFNYGPFAPSVEYKNEIDKFPFSVDAANATDVGDLSSTESGMGQSSTTHGYHTGGATPPYTNLIDKFPFSSDANATDIGDLTQKRFAGSGQSSTTHGYTSGGAAPPYSSPHNIIDKFPFSSDTNATDVGDLTESFYANAGHHV